MGQENFSFSGSGSSGSDRSKADRSADELRRAAGRGPLEPSQAKAASAPKVSGEQAATAKQSVANAEEAPAYTVSQLTREIEARLSQLGRVRVEGEVAGLRRASSGHVYFDLKEEGSLISCVVWRGQAGRALPASFDEGMQVLVRGKLDVYAPHGRYKLIVDRVEPLGIGALLAQLEELKREFKSAGKLDRRRALPTYPRQIGVVTSRDGAALRDFLRTRSLRWPAYPVRLVHTLVQGPGADQSIAEAIDRLDRSGVDVIVITRGGGSLQDLWCFNERSVADAIWRTSVPVVSAVGHESDTSLSDLVADFRAHTPTDAAQTVIPDRSALSERIERAGNRMIEAADEYIREREDRLERLANSRGLADPGSMLSERAASLRETRSRLELEMHRRLERARERMQLARGAMDRQSPSTRLARALSRLELLGEKLIADGERTLVRSGQRIELAARSLESISPLAVLGRGYSITSKGDSILVDSDALSEGDLFETRLLRGSVLSRAVEIRPAASSSFDRSEPE